MIVSTRLLAALLAASPAVVACKRTAPTGPDLGRIEFVAPSTPAEQTYTTRARITGLPASGSMYFQAHHEVIPEFVGRSGEVTGMPEMVMEFPAIAPGIDISKFRVGDFVRITFEVRWKSEPRTLITALEHLPHGEQPVLDAQARDAN